MRSARSAAQNRSESLAHSCAHDSYFLLMHQRRRRTFGFSIQLSRFSEQKVSCLRLEQITLFKRRALGKNVHVLAFTRGAFIHSDCSEDEMFVFASLR